MQRSANSRDVEWLHGISRAPWRIDLVVEVWHSVWPHAHAGQPKANKNRQVMWGSD